MVKSILAAWLSYAPPSHSNVLGLTQTFSDDHTLVYLRVNALLMHSKLQRWRSRNANRGLQALLMLTVPFAVMRVPAVGTMFDAPPITREGIVALLRLPVFRRVVLVAALILGSHAPLGRIRALPHSSSLRGCG